MQPFDWVLNKVISKPSWIHEVHSKIKPYHIFDKNKIRLYEYLLEFNESVTKLDANGEPVLDRSGKPEKIHRFAPTTIARIENDIGLSNYLNTITAHQEPSAKEARDQIDLALKHSKVTGMKRAFNLGIHLLEKGENPDKVNDEVFSLSNLMALATETQTFITQHDAVKEWDEEIKRKIDTNHAKVSIGFETLDHKLNGGVERGDLLVFASATGQGKSMLAGQTMVSFQRQGLKCGMIGLEMDHTQYAKRQFCYAAKLCGMKGFTQDMLDDPWKGLRNDDYHEVLDIVKQFDFTYLIPKQITVAELKKYCEILVVKYKADVIFLDHILLVMSTEEERKMVAEIVNFLKSFAAQHKVICVAVSQMNRDTDLEDPKVKDMSGGRSIEHAASQLITIGYRPQKTQEASSGYLPGKTQSKRRVDDGIRMLNIIKSRNSPSGVYALARFEGHNACFTEIFPENWNDIQNQAGYSRDPYIFSEDI